VSVNPYKYLPITGYCPQQSKRRRQINKLEGYRRGGGGGGGERGERGERHCYT